VQISSSKFPVLQQNGVATALRPRSEVRDTLENYLNPEGSVAKSTTYGQQVSGYAEFLNDAKFREVVENQSMTDEYSKTLSHDQKLAYHQFFYERLQRSNEVYPPNYNGQSASPAQLPAGARSIGSMFDSELNSGAVDYLKSVDRDEKAGVSPNTWADAFRARVTSLDHHFDLLRRTYQHQGKDTAEITAQYEKGLGDLYDYAKERGAAQKPVTSDT
jgi:hypothetical protein